MDRTGKETIERSRSREETNMAHSRGNVQKQQYTSYRHMTVKLLNYFKDKLKLYTHIQSDAMLKGKFNK